jgi:nucleoside-diphosphate-sugar epimerase
MRIFITGASGYIGFRVALILQHQGHQVNGLVRSETGAEKLKAVGIVPVLGELADTQLLRENASRADAIIHLAAYRGAGADVLDRNGVSAMLDGITGSGKAFIYTSGSSVYGDTGQQYAVETDPTVSNWRTQVEQTVLNTPNLHSIVIRPALVYGHGGGIIPRFINHAVETGTAIQIEDGKSFWSTIHVDDLARLYVTALENAPAQSIYNGAGESVRLGDVAETISRIYGINTGRWTVEEAVTVIGPIAGILTWNVQLASDKAQQELGWMYRQASLLEDIHQSYTVTESERPLSQ